MVGKVMMIATLVAVASSSGMAWAQGGSPKPETTATAKPGLVNLNTASSADLQRLPGIGERTATRILEYRQKNGPFKKIEELMNVQGIGEKSFLKLKSQITVAGSADRTGQTPPQE